MGEPIEQSGGHLRIAEDRRPFAEAQIGGDDDAGALVKLAEQVEQQGPAGGAEGQVAQLVQNHEIELGHCLGNLACFAFGLFLFKGVDQFDGGEEADLAAVMFDGLDAERGGNMGLAGSRATDQDHVLGAIHELAAVQGPDVGLINLAGSKVEAYEVLVCWGEWDQQTVWETVCPTNADFM